MDRPRSAGKFLDKELSWEGAQVVKSATKGGVYYGAYRTPQGQVIAVVAPYSYSKGEFIFKAMDESMGPYQTECPVAILNLLTSITAPHAIRWREKCRENAARRHIAARLLEGDVVKFDTPFSFGWAGTHDTFTVRYIGKKVRFDTGKNMPLCRITKWQSRPFTILARK
jgi:hypothetical protein